jgi:hypothetical protein
LKEILFSARALKYQDSTWKKNIHI